jgi:tetratricopeptide (TPR) repeat protein
MQLLRITDRLDSQGTHGIEISFEASGLARQTVSASFDFSLSSQEQEDIRWYLEDYLLNPNSPAPQIARRIESRMREIGIDLFKKMFQSSEDTRDLWSTVRPHVNETRLEIATSVTGAISVPWELLWDDKIDRPLALRTQAFVRTHSQPTQPVRIRPGERDRIRILLVICRPGGGEDVPFRSVAARLLKGLNEDAHAGYSLEVLRPPTFQRLGLALRRAKAEGLPYDVVHFDGHGMYVDLRDMARRDIELLDRPRARTGPHGYLLFENSELTDKNEFVDGPSLGSLLAETDVPVLILNACRSAHAEPPLVPIAMQDEPKNVHAEVRALGTLSQEIMDAGVAGVIAMRYNVHVATATRFVEDLYGQLVRGTSLGEAATIGRKQLEQDPMRDIGYRPVPLQDWMVPVIYEAAPIALFAVNRSGRIAVRLEDGVPSLSASSVDSNLPSRPDAGFIGRDETLLAVDRAFDVHNVVLLHAFAGSGKTASAAEFGRWYSITGGVPGRILFTSFEHYKPLVRVLDELQSHFEDVFEERGIEWFALSSARRREVAIDLLRKIPSLWIWDNVESIAGFPTGTDSAWSVEEQEALLGFLREVPSTASKCLLTSRRDENKWLGDLPLRIEVPPMPLQERVHLARALAVKHGRHNVDIQSWRPLLQFTQGNPLTVTVLARQALRANMQTGQQIDDFVARLRLGESAFEDESTQGRSKSLAASLDYGFRESFSEIELKQIALLHLFQGFVETWNLAFMGDERTNSPVPELAGVTNKIAAALLRRAADTGLLTAYDDRSFTLHPALPWFLKQLFDRHHSGSRIRAVRAYVNAISQMGNLYAKEYDSGSSRVVLIARLRAHEPNLLYARLLATANSWWDELALIIIGLTRLYQADNRRGEWERILDDATKYFIDPVTGGPIAGQEKHWSVITDSRVRIALAARRFGDAEQLQRRCLTWDQELAQEILRVKPDSWDQQSRETVERLATAVELLAHILRDQNKVECIELYKEAIDLYRKCYNRQGEGSVAFNLGHAYVAVSDALNLDEAERSYELARTVWSDAGGQAACLGALGMLSHRRLEEEAKGNKSEEKARQYMREAVGFFVKALDLMPEDSYADLGTTHNALGTLFYIADNFRSAIEHYREAARCSELAEKPYETGLAQYNIALAFKYLGQSEDAHDYADAARKTLKALRGTEADILMVDKLLAELDMMTTPDRKLRRTEQ